MHLSIHPCSNADRTRFIGIVAALGMIGSAPAQEPKVKTAAPKPKPDPAELAWVDEITRVPIGPHREIDPVAIWFNLSWNNVLFAGELAMAVDRNHTDELGVSYVGRGKGRSTGLARALWPYDVEALGRIDRESLSPQRFSLHETERGRTVDYQLELFPDRINASTTVLPQDEDGEPETKERIYRYPDIHDVLATGFYLRSIDLEPKQSVTLLIAPFNRPYLAEFTSLGPEKRKVRGTDYDTTKFQVAIRKINHDKTLQDYEKMKTAVLWLTDDEFRLPLEIHADIFIGFVSARMIDRRWLTPEEADGSATIPKMGKKKNRLFDVFRKAAKSAGKPAD